VAGTLASKNEVNGREAVIDRIDGWAASAGNCDTGTSAVTTSPRTAPMRTPSEDRSGTGPLTRRLTPMSASAGAEGATPTTARLIRSGPRSPPTIGSSRGSSAAASAVRA
jgi:hypothetical protein